MNTPGAWIWHFLHCSTVECRSLIDQIHQAVPDLAQIHEPVPALKYRRLRDGQPLEGVIERPDIENDPKFSSMEAREENCEELIRIIEEEFAKHDLWRRSKALVACNKF